MTLAYEFETSPGNNIKILPYKNEKPGKIQNYRKAENSAEAV